MKAFWIFNINLTLALYSISYTYTLIPTLIPYPYTPYTLASLYSYSLSLQEFRVWGGVLTSIQIAQHATIGPDRGVCPAGYTAHSDVSQDLEFCYKDGSTTKTWVEAAAECASDGAWLVTIKDAFKEAWVSAYADGNQFWIGLSDLDMDNVW